MDKQRSILLWVLLQYAVNAVEGDIYAAGNMALPVFACASYVQQYGVFGGLPLFDPFVDVCACE